MSVPLVTTPQQPQERKVEEKVKGLSLPLSGPTGKLSLTPSLCQPIRQWRQQPTGNYTGLYYYTKNIAPRLNLHSIKPFFLDKILFPSNSPSGSRDRNTMYKSPSSGSRTNILFTKTLTTGIRGRNTIYKPPGIELEEEGSPVTPEAL